MNSRISVLVKALLTVAVFMSSAPPVNGQRRLAPQPNPSEPIRKKYATSKLEAIPAAARLSVESLLARGERVFVGQLIDIQTRWGEGRKMIWTDYVFVVDETWNGSDERRIVLSVAGGTVDGQSILVSHTAQFELGETYLVSAWNNERLYHSAVLGGDRAYYRRAVDEATVREVFLDPEGRCLEAGPDGAVIPGRLAQPTGRPGFVRFPSEKELAAARAAEASESGKLEPVYTDPYDRVVAPLPVAPNPPAPSTTAVKRADLRGAMARERAVLLSASEK